MKIAEAKQAVMDIAKGEYHSLEYKLDDHGSGRVSQKCKVYIHGHGSFEATHWESAILQLKEAMTGRPAISEDVPLSKPRPTDS